MVSLIPTGYLKYQSVVYHQKFSYKSHFMFLVILYFWCVVQTWLILNCQICLGCSTSSIIFFCLCFWFFLLSVLVSKFSIALHPGQAFFFFCFWSLISSFLTVKILQKFYILRKNDCITQEFRRKKCIECTLFYHMQTVNYTYLCAITIQSLNYTQILMWYNWGITDV